MKFAIILLLALAGLILGIFLYRILIRSRCFANLIGGVIEPPPETPDEVIRHVDEAINHARNCANDRGAEARLARDEAATIRK